MNHYFAMLECEHQRCFAHNSFTEQAIKIVKTHRMRDLHIHEKILTFSLCLNTNCLVRNLCAFPLPSCLRANRDRTHKNDTAEIYFILIIHLLTC